MKVQISRKSCRKSYSLKLAHAIYHVVPVKSEIAADTQQDLDLNIMATHEHTH